MPATILRRSVPGVEVEAKCTAYMRSVRPVWSVRFTSSPWSILLWSLSAPRTLPISTNNPPMSPKDAILPAKLSATAVPSVLETAADCDGILGAWGDRD